MSYLTPPTCIIIGAGMTGLMAARALQDMGVHATVLDKGRSVGGRLATRRIDDAVFDHGAQFFTVRDPAFAAWVERWEAAGVVREWTRGFPKADGRARDDGHPRYIGVKGMTGIAKALAYGLDYHVGVRVVDVMHRRRWAVRAEDGQTFAADALLLTQPVPQSLALLEASGTGLVEEDRRALDAIRYEPCLALLVRLDRPSRLPPPGAIQEPDTSIAWIADNGAKGLCPPGALTIHAAPAFSRDYYTADDATVAGLMLAAAEPWLGAVPATYQVKRWRYSKPEAVHPAPWLRACDLPPLVFAGDAFGGPRVEGAALSGLAAAQCIVDACPP